VAAHRGEAAIPESAVQNATPFGKYLLLKRLAVGGMAELFLAQDTVRNEQVVIKRILPYLSREPEFVQMFLDEARIAAQLHHPNIVTVYELGKLEDSIFLAMEYVEGVDLRKILQQELKRNSSVPFRVAAYVTARVSGGLFYAHNTGGIDGRPLDLIHRDVSPQNVMVGYDGRVKLVDFGIAKAGAFMEQSKPGVIKGKFLYLSPEQLAQDKLDRRADLFATGTMLYEVTTGKSPFHRTTTEAVIYAIRVEEPVQPSQVRSEYPEALERIVLKCLSKDRSRRYQQASEIEQALDEYLATLEPFGQAELSRYVTQLYNIEQERTAITSPRPIVVLPAEQTVPAAPALQSGVARRITAEIKPLQPDDDPRTQTAHPDDIARALRNSQPATVKPPTRRPSAPEYASVGGDELTRTDSNSSESSGANAGHYDPDRATAPVLGKEAPTRQDRPEGAAGLVLDPDAIPERLPESGVSPLRDVDESTLDFDSRKVAQAMVWRSPWVLGVGAFLGVAVIGIGVLWLAQSKGEKYEARPPPPRPIAMNTPPPTPKPVVTPPIPVALAEIDAGPGVSEDAGVAEPDTPTHLVPEPTPAPPRPTPAPHPPHRRLVTLVFNAVSGTRILRDGRSVVPGHRYAVQPGSVKYEYVCPGKKVLVTKTIRIAPSERSVVVPIWCKAR
jgi:serine/threonine protein kinase